jgi:hypothetical protein
MPEHRPEIGVIEDDEKFDRWIVQYEREMNKLVFEARKNAKKK